MEKIFKIKNAGKFDILDIHNAIEDFINFRFPGMLEEDETTIIPLPMEEGPFEDQNVKFIITPISTTGVTLKHYKRNIIELVLPEYGAMGDATVAVAILEYLMQNFTKPYFKAGYTHDTCSDRGFISLLDFQEKNVNELLRSEKYLKGEFIVLPGYACPFFFSSRDIDYYNGDITLAACEKFWNTFGQLQLDYLKCVETSIETDSRIQGTYCSAYNVENVFMPPAENIVLVKGVDCKVIPRSDIQKLRSANQSVFEHIYFPDSMQTIVRKMPDEEYDELYKSLPYPEIKDFIKAHIIRWNPAISNIKTDEYLEWEENFAAPDYWISWSFRDYQDIRIGDYVFMEVVGQDHKGIIMSGIIVELPEKDDDWSGRGREVYYAKFHVTAMTDPRITSTMLSAEILEKEIPDFNWEKGHSGELLSQKDARRMVSLWDAHINNLKKRGEESILNEDTDLKNVRIRGWEKPELKYNLIPSTALFLDKEAIDPELISVPLPKYAKLTGHRLFEVEDEEENETISTEADIYSVGNDFKLNYIFSPEEQAVLTIYPTLKGAEHDVTIEKVAVWPGKSIATVFASTGNGEKLNFVASDWYDNRNLYQHGAKLTVEVGGIVIAHEAIKAALPGLFMNIDITSPELYILSGVIESQKSFRFQNNDCKTFEISLPDSFGASALPVYAPCSLMPPVRKGNDITCTIQLIGRISSH